MVKENIAFIAGAKQGVQATSVQKPELLDGFQQRKHF